MKYVKMLGLLAVAAAALMAFAGSASADEFTSGGSQYNGKIKASAGNFTLKAAYATITCKESVIDGSASTQGAGKTIEGSISHLTFNECNHTVTVFKNGAFSIHATETNKGTFTSSGTEITVVTHGLLIGTIHCFYTTSSTDIGTVTGGTAATLHATSELLGQVPTDFACGSEGSWNGYYTFTTPHELHLDDN